MSNDIPDDLRNDTTQLGKTALSLLDELGKYPRFEKSSDRGNVVKLLKGNSYTLSGIPQLIHMNMRILAGVINLYELKSRNNDINSYFSDLNNSELNKSINYLIDTNQNVDSDDKVNSDNKVITKIRYQTTYVRYLTAIITFYSKMETKVNSYSDQKEASDSDDSENYEDDESYY
jgi:hypothetical protein